MTKMVIWETVEGPPGYFGKHRAERHQEFDERFGVGKWRIAWQLEGHTGLFDEAVMLYEDAYLAHLEANPDQLSALVGEAREVYDDAPSNVDSGVNYRVQETGATHLQDIALRRCLVRLKLVFRGQELIQIRSTVGDHPLSTALSPGRVPFHRAEMIVTPELTGWWDPRSIESFWQSNKQLQVRQFAA